MSLRVRAPALVGRRWLNAGAWPGGGPTLAGLRGRVAVLHFSTAGCVNCTHAEAELDALVAARPGVVVIGVHSPKFPHEATVAALDAAVGRAGTTHPVLDDAERTTWDAYAVGAWPTLVVLDPGGRVAGTFVGEGHLAALDALVGDLLREAPVPASEPPAAGPVATVAAVAAGEPDTLLRYPSAALALPDGRLLVSDAGHRRLVLLDLPDTPGAPHRGGSVPGAGGSGAQIGGDGWVSPAGAALLPPEIAARVGWDVAVADPGAHLVRGLRLADGSVVTVAGTGEPLRPDAPAAARGGAALGTALSSPTGLAWSGGRLVVAMAGLHQLWTLEVAPDPADGVLRPVAGSGVEGLLDGAGAAAMLAQPSAVAAADPHEADDGLTDGQSAGVWFIDAESSSLRRARSGPHGVDGAWEVTTLVGTGVHAFGHVDGDAADALMQHPLGVAVADDGAVLVADTYDGAVRRVDVAREAVTTLVDALAEPVAVVVVPGGVAVVESAAHRVVHVALAREHAVAPGPVEILVDLAVPPGQRLDGATGADGPPVRLEVTALPPDLLDAPATTDALCATVSLRPGAGTLVVRAGAATCDDGAPGATGAACHLHERTWRVPVVVRAGATTGVTLRWAP